MTAPRPGDGDGYSAPLPPWSRDRALENCPHGRIRINCADCTLVAQQERATASPEQLVRLDHDVEVPDPGDPTRSTFYAAGTRVPSSLLPDQPKAKPAKR